jgi:hypothetical protein
LTGAADPLKVGIGVLLFSNVVLLAAWVWFMGAAEALNKGAVVEMLVNGAAVVGAADDLLVGMGVAGAKEGADVAGCVVMLTTLTGDIVAG